MPLLTAEQFQSTFVNPMTQLGPEAQPPFDFWPYFEKIPQEHFGEYHCPNRLVACVYSNADQTYLHLLIESKEENVFMVLILDLIKNEVFGHLMMNANTGEILGVD